MSRRASHESARLQAIGALWLIGALLPLITVAWALIAGTPLPPLPDGTRGPVEFGPAFVVYTVIFVPAAFVGASLAVRPGSPPIAWILLATGAVHGVAAFASVYATHALFEQPGSLPGAQVAAVLTSLEVLASVLIASFGLLMLPTGRLPAGRARWLLAAPLIVGGGRLLSQVLAAGPLRDYGFVENPLALGGRAGELAETLNPFVLWPLALLPNAIWLVGQALRSGEPRVRRVLTRVAAMTVVIPVSSVLLTDSSSPLAFLPALGLLILLTDVTIFSARRETLWGMPSLVHRTVLWMGSTSLIALGFVAGIGLLAALGTSGGGWLWVALAAGIALAAPVRAALDRRLRRRLLGDGADPAPAILRLHRQLDADAGARDAPRIVAETVARATRAAHVELSLVLDDRLTHVVATGAPARGDRALVPISADGVPIGAITLVVPDGEVLLDAERRLAGRIAAQAAPALGHWRRLEELAQARANRERLVGRERGAAERALRRQLLGLLHRLGEDFERVEELDAEPRLRLLDEAHAALGDAVVALRRVTHELADVRPAGAPPAPE